MQPWPDMSVREDVINLKVNVNGNQSQNQLNELRKRAVELTNDMKGLKKGTDEYVAASKELKKVNADMVELKKTIGITALSQKELIKELGTLKALRGSVVPFSNEYKELSKSIKLVEDRLYDVKNGVQGFASFFSKIKDEVKQFGILAAGYLGFQFLFTSFQNLITGAGKLSDQLADLRRVAGLTSEEAIKLSKSLGQIDTRTSTSQLRDIAIVAGKLGVAKNDILGFVEATDKLVVALGDELGDADQITTELGKILNVFNGKVDGTALTQLGNAIVELANAGVATGGFISDFTQRVSGLAKASNLSLGATVGLAAGFEELGLRSESSATALQKVLSTIASDLPKAAKIAGAQTQEQVQEFIDLFAKTPGEALIKFAEGLSRNKTSFAEVTASFKDAGEEGARVIQVLNAIGQQGDFLREKISLGNKSVQESTAINEAFALKNETVGATLDKLQKEFAKMVNSPAVQNFLKGAIEGALSFIRALSEIPKFIKDNIVALALLTTGIVINNAARLRKIALLAIEKLGLQSLLSSILSVSIAERAAAIAGTALAGVKALLAGNVTRAAAAFRLLSIQIGANPLGVLLIAVGAAVIAFKALADASGKAAAAERVRQEIYQKAGEATAEESSRVQYLTAVIKDNTVSLDTRKDALKKLIEISPEYLKGLTLENIATAEGQAILERYNEQLQNKARLEAAGALLAEKAKKDNELALQQRELESKLANSNSKPGLIGSTLASIPGVNAFVSQENSLAAELGAVKAARNEIKTEMDEIVKLSIGFEKTKDEIINRNKLSDASQFDLFANGKTGSKPDSSIAARIKELEALIASLKEKYLQLNVTDKEGQRENLDLQRKYQRELALLKGEEDKKGNSASTKRENELKSLIEQSKKFYEEVKRIKAKADTEELSPRDREVEQVNIHYGELLQKAEDYFEKLKKLTGAKGKEYLAAEQRVKDERAILEAASSEEILAIIRKYNKKEFDERTKDEYAEALVARKEYSEDLKQAAALDYANGVTTKKQFDAEIKTIERNERNDLVVIAQDYSGNVKQAESDLRKFRKANAKATTDEQIEEAERLKAYNRAELLAEAKRGVLTNRPGTDANRDAQKRVAGINFLFDTEELDEQSEQYKERYQEFLDELQQIDTEYLSARTEQFASYFQAALDIFTKFSDFLSAKENAELNRDKRRNDEKKRNYQKLLNEKLISQAVYDKKVAEADEAYDKKKKALERKQFERNKKIQIAQAIIGGAVAFVNALQTQPVWLGIAMAAVTAVLTGLQVATISKQQPPEYGEGGLLRNGPKHNSRSRGLQVVNPETGRIEALVERNEAIMSSDTMDDRNHYSVSGTPSQIASTLNGINGGATWDRPAKVVPIRPAWQSQPLPRIRSSVPKMMADGGRLPDASAAGLSQEAALEMQRMQVAELQALRNEIAAWDRERKSYVVLKELKSVEQQYDQSKQASGF